MAKPVVAVVEGDPMIALLMNEFLTEDGYVTHVWTESEGAAQFVRSVMPNLVILDLWIRRRGDGWGILEQLREDRLTCAIPVIICSTDRQLLQQLDMKLRTLGCESLEKPFQVADLLAMAKECLLSSNPTMVHQEHQVPSLAATASYS